MSNVKITYKPVGKRSKAKEYLESLCGSILQPDYATTISNDIDAIYNTKEGDGEIRDIRIIKNNYSISAYEALGLGDLQIAVSLNNSHTEMTLCITRQESLELGQALIKMSGCDNQGTEKTCANCSYSPCALEAEDCQNHSHWKQKEPIKLSGEDKTVNYKEVLENQIKILQELQNKGLTWHNCTSKFVEISKQIQSLTECLIDRQVHLGK